MGDTVQGEVVGRGDVTVLSGPGKMEEPFIIVSSFLLFLIFSKALFGTDEAGCRLPAQT